MAWLQPVKMHLDWTLAIVEGTPPNRVVGAIQTIAMKTIVPIWLIAHCEALSRWVICTIAHLLCTIINKIHALFLETKLQ